MRLSNLRKKEKELFQDVLSGSVGEVLANMIELAKGTQLIEEEHRLKKAMTDKQGNLLYPNAKDDELVMVSRKTQNLPPNAYASQWLLEKFDGKPGGEDSADGNEAQSITFNLSLGDKTITVAE
jgi:hypothetical protein